MHTMVNTTEKTESTWDIPDGQTMILHSGSVTSGLSLGKSGGPDYSLYNSAQLRHIAPLTNERRTEKLSNSLFSENILLPLANIPPSVHYTFSLIKVYSARVPSKLS